MKLSDFFDTHYNNWEQFASKACLMKSSADILFKSAECKSIDDFIKVSNTADSLFENENNWMVSIYLYGIALEQVLKALVLINTSEKTYIYHHELKELKKILINNQIIKTTEFTNEELEIFDRLEPFLIWAGRYNFPTNPEKYINEHKKVYEASMDLNRIVLEDLFNKLFNLLNQ